MGGLNLEELFFEIKGMIARIRRLMANAKTPPSLLGIDRRIA